MLSHGDLLRIRIYFFSFAQPIRIFTILADSFEEGIANPKFEAVGLQIRWNYKKILKLEINN